MKKIFSTALFGPGRMGMIHAKNFLSLGQNIKYIVYPDIMNESPVDFVKESLGKYYNDKMNIISYTNFFKIKNDEEIDGFIIASSTDTHVSVAKELVNKYGNKPIFMEKPVAQNLKSTINLYKFLDQKKYGDRLILNFNQKSDKLKKIIKEIIDSGEIGNLQNIRIYYYDNPSGLKRINFFDQIT